MEEQCALTRTNSYSRPVPSTFAVKTPLAFNNFKLSLRSTLSPFLSAKLHPLFPQWFLMVSSKSMKNKSKTNTIIVRSKGNPISIQYTTPVLFFFRILNFSFSFRWWCFRLVLLLSHWFKRLFLFPPLRILCAFHSRSSLQSLRFAPHSFSFHSLSDQFVVFFPLFFCCLFGFFFFHFSLWIFLCV